jgi:hypothetical protein
MTRPRIVARTALGVLLVAAASSAAPAPRAGINDSWPRQFTTARGSRVVIYQPQAETFRGETVTGRAAVSVTRKTDSSPKFGVVFFEARVSVDRDSRTVSILGVKVRRVRFPSITPDREKTFSAILEEEIPKWQLVVSYDRLLESLKVAERERRSAEGLKNEPPRIGFAQEPTVLVVFDGEPRLKEIPGGPFQSVINTPFFMVFDSRTRQYFLAGGSRWWYRASDPKGPWVSIDAPPRDVEALAARSGSQTRELDDGTQRAGPPKILVATEPTELVVSEGKPTFKPVASLDLLYMDNSEGDVLLDVPSQTYFVLLAGRWFKNTSLSEGGWTFVPPDSLPPSFSKIPPDSPVGDVLASVAGTDEAEEALLDAQIPETAAVKRSTAKLEVRYDGEPKFAAIEGTSIRYAVNASTEVLEIRGRYYACDNAVWFVADTPTGLWALADSVPSADLEAIPPSAPVYNVKYVTIYDSTPDVVYVGYTPGYLGSYACGNVMVWGTGFYYQPWVGLTYYWPWPWTWGFGAHYDAWDGWCFGISWWLPFYDFGFGWRPGWEDWHQRGWWGPRGYRPPATVVREIREFRITTPGAPRPRPVPVPRRPPPAARPSPGPISRPGIGFRPNPGSIHREMLRNNLYDRLPDNERATQPSRPDMTRPLAGRADDVYAGPRGDIFRRTIDGKWQERDGRTWKPAIPAPSVTPVTPPGAARPPVAPPRGGLERDFSARQRGETRAREMGFGSRGAPRPAPAPPRSQPPPKPARR